MNRFLIVKNKNKSIFISIFKYKYVKKKFVYKKLILDLFSNIENY